VGAVIVVKLAGIVSTIV